ncbi:MAG: S-adenosylmethionine:tRNA ribosyltransferase-isomerase [Parcubacteria group bacterium ADurb.Bin326]|nr:MAG: S-adenosylmethionine:tRNA ribosyltransferase-isomerase [Parcubacteria group bacterium ADurb.Bin326]
MSNISKGKKKKLSLSDFDYVLPSELIAQEPIKPRDAARLLVLDKKSGKMMHQHFFDLPEILRPGDVLVFNNSKVIPARLYGTKPTGGKVEIFLLQPAGRGMWQCLVKGKVKTGEKITLAPKVIAESVKQLEDGREWLIKFNVNNKKLFSLGETPTPPYIKKKADLKDYQTVFAKTEGSVAASTAGLHFTKKLLHQLKQRGIKVEFVTLHVGLGTFASVETENILEHKMHSEWASIDAATAKRLVQAKSQGKRIIAVGTTASRVLESFADRSGAIKEQNGWTDIFIYPGYKFKFVDALITNFHLPKSTLLMLVSALASKKNIDQAYREAVRLKYKFFSFGDGMLIK